jgi:hypothetical protein
MRSEEIVQLAAGTIITRWPASTGGGGEIILPVRPTFVVLDAGRYLVKTDTVTGAVSFQRLADPGAAP